MKETQATRQIHSISDEELSRWIAEKIYPGGPKEWQLDAPYLKNNPWQLAGRQWIPRDMVNDAQMTVMLLKRMIAEESSFIIGLQGVAHRMSARFTSGMNGAEYGELLGRAVAEAFMLANGYKAC